MPTPIASDMLRLFREGVNRYQPAASGLMLEEETGCPQVSTRNVAKLLEGDRVITKIMLKPGRALILFHNWETQLALGLSLNESHKREALTRITIEDLVIGLDLGHPVRGEEVLLPGEAIQTGQEGHLPHRFDRRRFPGLVRGLVSLQPLAPDLFHEMLWHFRGLRFNRKNFERGTDITQKLRGCDPCPLDDRGQGLDT